ncbi:MAG: diguanylate cyclase [Syntrophomonadaceae bacterium]|nr:diguanylate cyclase [Syntrophomonadaceae bacterium]
MEVPRQTVLAVDDSLLNLQIIADILKDECDVLTARNGAEAIRAACSDPPPDLILLDIVMPDMDGFEVCKRIKTIEKTKDIPIIYLTGMNNEYDEEYGLSLGAIDYITKPFKPSILRARVRNHLQLKYYRDRLARIGMIDGVTGIPNRRRFDEVISLEWRRATRSSQPLSLIMGDIDYFKNYNDTYGHLEGDACLRKVANRFCEILKRPGDLVGRWGGEEFACILPETEIGGAVTVAERIRKGIIDLAIPHLSSPIAPVVTVSLGVTTMVPKPGQDPIELIRRSDEALYKAKKAGRNRVAVFDDQQLLLPQTS